MKPMKPKQTVQYLDKILEVKGEVTEVTKNQKGETVIALKGTDMSGVRCTIEGAAPQDIKNGASTYFKRYMHWLPYRCGDGKMCGSKQIKIGIYNTY